MSFRINKVIKHLIWGDFAFWSAVGLFEPIFAIFIINNVKGGDALVVGIAAAIYWIVKSIISVPIGMFLDKNLGEKDDYWFLVNGAIISSIAPLIFIFCRLPWHVYLVQIIYAVGMAMTVSGWQAIFTRHIDKGQEATEWSIDTTVYGIGTGVFGLVGGWVEVHFGFIPIFAGVSAISFVSVIFLLGLKGRIHGERFSFRKIINEFLENAPRGFLTNVFKRFR